MRRKINLSIGFLFIAVALISLLCFIDMRSNIGTAFDRFDPSILICIVPAIIVGILFILTANEGKRRKIINMIISLIYLAGSIFFIIYFTILYIPAGIAISALLIDVLVIVNLILCFCHRRVRVKNAEVKTTIDTNQNKNIVSPKFNQASTPKNPFDKRGN